jgi:hypothetical protein
VELPTTKAKRADAGDQRGAISKSLMGEEADEPVDLDLVVPIVGVN